MQAMKSNILALAAIGLAVVCAVFFYSSVCPQRSFAIGTSMVTAGSLACEQQNTERAQQQTPTQKIINGGI
jgi:hypothetical protein